MEKSHADKSPIKIREFKYYREILFPHGTVLIDKKKLTFFYSGKSGNLKLDIGALGKTFTYSKKDTKQTHYLVSAISKNKNKKIGYYASNHITQYQDNERACDDLRDKFAKNIDRIVTPDLIAKIKNLEVTNLFDKETCGAMTKERFEEFKGTLIGSLVGKQSKMKRCMESEDARKIFLQDTGLLNNANEVFEKYLSLIEGLEKSKLKLKCGMKKGDENKVASFSQNPMEIAINIVNEKFNLGIENIKTVLNHELLHLGMQQFKDKEGSRCIDEGLVQLFENVCQYNSSSDKKPINSSEVVSSCLQGIKPEIDKLTSNNSITSRLAGEDCCKVATAVASAPRENRDQARAVTETLQAEIRSGREPSLVPIPDSTIQITATAPVLATNGRTISSYEGDGEFHQVVGDSSFSASVQQLGQSLSASMDGADKILTSALGNTGMVAAVAVVGVSAIASTKSSSGAASQVSPLTTSEIFMNRYYPDSPSVQAALNNPKTDNMTYDQKEAYYRSLGGGSAGSAQIASVESVATKSGAEPSVASAKNAVGSSGVTATASRSVASVGGAAPIDTPKDEKTNEQPVPKKAAAAVGGDGAQSTVQGAAGRLDNAIIQRLSAFSKVNEPAYSRVAERFADETFQQQLNARKIRILGEDGKPLWASNVRPERCFRDNKTTKVLEVVTCK